MTTDPNEAQIYQISFINGHHSCGDLFQYDFLATADEVSAFAPALDTALLPYVRDLQVYKPLQTFSESTALGTVRDILSAVGEDDENTDGEKQGFAELLSIAAEIDAHAKPDDCEPWTLDFVWNNGGGDDNASSQDFLGPIGCPALERRLVTCLDNSLSIRAVRVSRGVLSPDGDFSDAIEDLTGWLDRSGMDEAASVVRRAWSDHKICAEATSPRL